MEKSRILVVEDESIVARDIQGILRELGYDVPSIASSGEDAVKEAKEDRPDLVLMDIVLKGEMNGIDAAGQIRSSLDIPILYLTAYTDEEIMEQAKVTEPFGYLIKPFDSKALHTAIEVALYKHSMEKKLRESEEWLSTTLNSIGDAVIATDKQGSVIFINPVAARLTGWKIKDALGKQIEEILHLVNDETDEKINIPIEEIIRKGEALDLMDYSLVAGDGSAIPVEAALIAKNEQKLPIEDSLAPIINVKGEVRGAVLVFRDITERRSAKEATQRLMEQLLQAQKLESVGRLAGGVAHDFNNMLSAICGNAELLLMKVKEADPLRSNLETIFNAGKRAADLTQQLLAFSRKQLIKPEVLNLNALIKEVRKILVRVIGEDIEIEVIDGADLWNVKADRSQIEQVIMNLAVNARDAMPTGGKLTIETRNAILDEQYAESHFLTATGEYVMLAVSDTGHGITEEVKAYIFEPFFTTKAMGEGTGLGLSTVYGIVKQNDGDIDVYSKPDEGSTFRIYLPRTKEEPEIRKEKRSEDMPRGTENVLLVEDENAVREIAASALSGLGYNVIKARDGFEALDLCIKNHERIHLLLADVVMPGMSGNKLAERMKEMCPSLKVLFMSGYAEGTIAKHGIVDKEVNFLGKPINIRTLAQTVRKVLDSE